jgi:general secretion pathway protein K
VTPKSQRGAVLIMVLWTAVVLTVLVTVLATNIRLGATTALRHKEGVSDYADIMTAMNQAEMELMLERMPLPLDEEPVLNDWGEVRMSTYRFNGQPLSLHYPAPENMVVRIYDHAGKINLNRIEVRRLQQIIETQLGPDFDPRQVQELLAAWNDWTDLNELITPGGAEAEYYQTLDPPYTPRNSPDLESVDEILLIRGFAELFEGVNLEAAFTVYGNEAVVNPNMATREALMLLPGMEEEIAEQIIAYRQHRDMRTPREVGAIVPLENMVELSPWLGFSSSSIYSVYVYPMAETANVEQESQGTDGDPFAVEDPVRQGYMQIMQVDSFNQRARVRHVDPYAILPDTAPPRAELPPGLLRVD